MRRLGLHEASLELPPTGGRIVDLARMSLNYTAAKRAQDERTAAYWAEEIERESDRLEREAHAAEWDVLKGSPEHG